MHHMDCLFHLLIVTRLGFKTVAPNGRSRTLAWMRTQRHRRHQSGVCRPATLDWGHWGCQGYQWRPRVGFWAWCPRTRIASSLQLRCCLGTICHPWWPPLPLTLLTGQTVPDAHLMLVHANLNQTVSLSFSATSSQFFVVWACQNHMWSHHIIRYVQYYWLQYLHFYASCHTFYVVDGLLSYIVLFIVVYKCNKQCLFSMYT